MLTARYNSSLFTGFMQMTPFFLLIDYSKITRKKCAIFTRYMTVAFPSLFMLVCFNEILRTRARIRNTKLKNNFWKLFLSVFHSCHSVKAEAYAEPSQISRMEVFARTVNSNYFCSFILGVWLDSECDPEKLYRNWKVVLVIWHLKIPKGTQYQLSNLLILYLCFGTSW